MIRGGQQLYRVRWATPSIRRRAVRHAYDVAAGLTASLLWAAMCVIARAAMHLK
jgi:hypothetical protein